MLPWAAAGENNGQRPFEPYLLQVPDISLAHSESISDE